MWIVINRCSRGDVTGQGNVSSLETSEDSFYNTDGEGRRVCREKVFRILAPLPSVALPSMCDLTPVGGGGGLTSALRLPENLPDTRGFNDQ